MGGTRFGEVATGCGSTSLAAGEGPEAEEPPPQVQQVEPGHRHPLREMKR